MFLVSLLLDSPILHRGMGCRRDYRNGNFLDCNIASTLQFDLRILNKIFSFSLAHQGEPRARNVFGF